MIKNTFFLLYSALMYLRLRNIGHRDIKPKNIIDFLNNNGEYIWKIADFGVGISYQ